MENMEIVTKYPKLLDHIKGLSESYQLLALQLVESNYYNYNKMLNKDVFESKINVDMRVKLMRYNNQDFNDLVAFLIGLTLNVNLVDNEEDNVKLFNMIRNLNEDGYVIYDKKLEKYDNIISKCGNLEYHAKYIKKYVKGINLTNPISITHWIKDMRDIFYLSEVQELIMDPEINLIVKNYLQSEPILWQTNFWWSKENRKRIGTKDHSQMFHQDQDDIKFIKLFIYLNDVDMNNGPHSYVKGSIRDRKTPFKGYKISNRVTDSVIESLYGKDKIVYLEGKAGTMIFENTNGFHKGMMLNKGTHRFMLQLEWCCSTVPYENNKHEYVEIDNNKLSDKMKDFTKENPKLFLRYKFVDN